jgi:phage terminase large subunit
VYLPKQQQTLAATRTHRFILYSGAYGAGKTLLLCNAIIEHALENPGAFYLIGCQTYPMLRDTVLRTFMEEMRLYQTTMDNAKQEISIIKDWNKTNNTMTLCNSSQIIFRSCEVGAEHLKSLNLDGFGLDEPVDIDESIFLMLQGRLRGINTKHHMGILTGNPGGFDSWVYKYFFDRRNPDYISIQTNTYDNIYLPQDYIRSMEESFDSDYARRYIQGYWGSFEGLVYKDFDKEKHVGEYSKMAFNNHIAGYDDGYRNPACLLIAGIDSNNKLFVLHELYLKNFTSGEISYQVQDLYKKYGVRKIFCDPSGLNAIETFKRDRMYALDADNSKKGEGSGISKLKTLFKTDSIFIDKSCVNLINQLQSYRYEKDKASGNYNEEPVKKDDHAVDALRYLVTEYDPFKRFVPGVAFDWIVDT